MALSDLLASFKAFTKRSSIAQYRSDLDQLQATLNGAYGEKLALEQSVASDGGEVVDRAERLAQLGQLIPALERRKAAILGEMDQLERAEKEKADAALAKTAAADLDRQLLALEAAEQARNRETMAMVALLNRLVDPDVRRLLPSDPTANRRRSIEALLGDRLPPGIRSFFADGFSLSIPEAQRRAAELAGQVGQPAPQSRVLSEVKL